ncbi:MAG: MFS transporter [Planctomycetota bacterium]|jgi:MFS family permease
MTNDHSKPGFLRNFIGEFTVMRGSPRELWLIYVTKVLEIVAYGLMSSTLILWLSSDMGFSDAAAGDTIAWWSTVLTLITVLVGSLVDAIGIRRSFLLGFWLCLLSRAVMTAAANPWIAIPFGMLPLAAGLALMVPVMNAALKRYATTRQQTMAFALFYMLMNLGFLIAGFLFDYVRDQLGELRGTTILGMEMSTYRVLFFWATVATLPGLILTHIFMRRGVEGTDDEGVLVRQIESPYKDRDVLTATVLSMRDAGRNTARIFASIWREPNFYRFLVFLSLIVLVRLVFYHMHYTFPKFGIRELGPGAPIGNLWTVLNAGLIFLLTLPVAALSSKVSSYKMLTIGTIIAAVPVFFLAMPPAWFQPLADGFLGDFIGHRWLGVEGAVDPLFISVTLFVVFFSIGEAIWSPRLYQYTAAIAPKGKEGSYMALSLLPYFVAKLIVGMLSGRMLERWCPDDDVLARRRLVEEYGADPALYEGMDKETVLRALADKMGYPYDENTILAQDYGIWEQLHGWYPRESQTLWLVVALMAICCPIGIILLRNVIRSREDVGGNSGEEEGEEPQAAS